MIRLLSKALRSSISIRVMAVCLGFLSSIFVNRILGLSSRGSYTNITAYANLLQSFLNLGLAFAYAPLCAKFGRGPAKSCVLILSWSQFVVYLTISVTACALAQSVDILLIGLLATLQTLNGQITFISLIEDIRSRNSVLLKSSAAYLFTILMLWITGYGNLATVILALILKTAYEIVACALHDDMFNINPTIISTKIVLYTLKIGLPTALVSLLITFNYNIDVILLNIYKVSNTELGIFGLAYSLSNMLWFIPDAFKEYVYNQSSNKDYSVVTVVLITLNMLICVVICLGFAAVGKIFLRTLYGDEFTSAYTATLIVFVGVIPMIAFKLIHPIYINSGRPIPVVILLVASILINIIVARWTIPWRGADGAAFATVASYTACGMLFLIMFIRDYKITVRNYLDEFKRLFNLYNK